jgi:16S rRNA (guanosine(1370)-2'-O)-methyltransferase
LSNALPATKVLLPKGCADPWETKAIRGSSGSVFFMPTETSLTWQQIDKSLSSGEDTIADNDTSKYYERDVIEYDKIPDEIIAGRNIIIIIGGETHGIGDEAKDFTSKRNWRVINVPLDATVNSLNTSNALAIVLFELRRKLSSLQ